MGRLDLDKYYTDKNLARYCIKKAKKTLNNIEEVIEPSAGNGSFSLQLPNCTAFDINPGHDSIIKQDFLNLELPYKKNRLFIGNPPFGNRNTLSVKFFKHAVKMGDMIAFILPASQYNNNQQMYEFDLIYSKMLPLFEYCKIKLLCCFNIYIRPKNGKLNSGPKNYKLKDVEIKEWRRGGRYSVPSNYDLGICSWGAAIGKEIKYQGQFALENYLTIINRKHKKKVIEIMKNADWKTLYPNIATPRLGQWKIYKYLKEQMPVLN